jgi:hypothetical protein
VIEVDLRSLARELFAAEWEAVLGGETVEILRGRRDEEARRRAPMAVPSDLLDYTHFRELRRVIESDWARVGPVLGKKREFEVWANQIEDFRNAPAHSRELLGHERLLLEGIAGMIRARVTKHRSQRGPDMNYYPVIESATDSFGNAFSSVPASQMMNILVTNTALVPGQEVRFRLRATDPQGRALAWQLDVDGSRKRAQAVGSESEIVWVVDDIDVRELVHAKITVTSTGKYHRFTHFDHSVTFRYRVLPPESERGEAAA